MAMSSRPGRRWFAAIPITGRFYIMFAVLLLSIGGVLFGALRATQAQSDAGSDLAHVAAVQRSLDRALTLQASIGTPMSQGATPGAAQTLVTALRAQLEATWALPVTPEVAAI